MAAEDIRVYNWKKGGPSPNPGGRPKAATAVAALLLASTENMSEVVKLVLNVMRGLESGMENDKNRRWAIDWITNYAIGKPRQAVEVTSGEPVPLPDLTAMTLDELRRMAAGGDGDPGDDVH